MKFENLTIFGAFLTGASIITTIAEKELCAYILIILSLVILISSHWDSVIRKRANDFYNLKNSFKGYDAHIILLAMLTGMSTVAMFEFRSMLTLITGIAALLCLVITIKCEIALNSHRK